MEDKEQGTKNYVWNKKDKIGEGSFAVVFEGRNRKTQEKVAIKVCTLKKCTKYDGLKYIEDIRLFEKFDSPYITTYLADEEVEDSTRAKSAIVMELANGSLRHELSEEQNRNGVPKRTFLTLVHDCVLALEYLDAQNLSHRDIKPDNILVFLQPRMTFKLSDFGTCLQLEEPGQSMHTDLGTPAYMPTSMIHQKASDSEVKYTKDQYDVWAMACCFFEGATARRPFMPRANGQFDKEMSELFLHRPNDIACAQFDEKQGKYVYQKDLPQQHGSYSREFRIILAKYFQLMFNREKKFLNVSNFSALSQELTTIREHIYYCLNTLTAETYCDTEHSEFFPKKTLLNAIQNVARSGDEANPGQVLPPETQQLFTAFTSEAVEPRATRSVYKEPFLAAMMPWSLVQNRFVSMLATWYEIPSGVRMEIQSSDGIRVADKKLCTLRQLANQGMNPSLSEYLDRRTGAGMDAPEDPVPLISAQAIRKRNTSGNPSSDGRSGESSPNLRDQTRRPTGFASCRSTRHSTTDKEYEDQERQRAGNQRYGTAKMRGSTVRPTRSMPRRPLNPSATFSDYEEYESGAREAEAAQNPFQWGLSRGMHRRQKAVADQAKRLEKQGQKFAQHAQRMQYEMARMNPFANFSGMFSGLANLTDNFVISGEDEEQDAGLANLTGNFVISDEDEEQDACNQEYVPPDLHRRRAQFMHPMPRGTYYSSAKSKTHKCFDEEEGRTTIHKTSDWTPLMWAAYGGRLDLAEPLVRRRQNLNEQSRDTGESALSLAAIMGHTDIVQLLLDHEANVNIEKKDHFTPLHCACQEGRLETARRLLNNSASISAKSRLDWTPFLTAAANGWCEVASLLIKRGADVDVRSRNNNDAVLLAASNGHADMVKLLSEHMSVSERNKDGVTALHMACQNGHFDTATLLLEKGAVVHAITKSGLTPLMVAEKCRHRDIAELLHDWGAEE